MEMVDYGGHGSKTIRCSRGEVCQPGEVRGYAPPIAEVRPVSLLSARDLGSCTFMKVSKVQKRRQTHRRRSVSLK
jgi:hypothetical protein